MEARARQICQSNGLMIVERGVAIETLASAIRGMDADLVYDALLAKECRCAAVIGTEEQADKARKELNVFVPEQKVESVSKDAYVEPPTFDEDYGFAFRCIHPGIQELAEVYMTSFRNGGATNYMAHEFTDRETGDRYQMVIQKVSGLTPLDRLSKYQRAIEELKGSVSVEDNGDYEYLHADGIGFILKCEYAPTLTELLRLRIEECI